MADEATTTVAAVPETVVTTSGTGTAATATPAEAQKTDTAEPMIPKSRLDEVLAKLKTFEGDKTKAEKAAKDAETARLAEQGEYKKIADNLQAELQTAQSEAKTAATKLLQRDAATQTGLPAALADRLKGETLDEMVADAQTILAALPKPAAPNINAQSGAGGAPVAGQMSDAEKQELAARLGVNAKYM